MSGVSAPQAEASRWRVAALAAADAPEVRGLFASVFGKPMSDALWRWKYRGDDWRAAGVRDASGRLVAHYGGLRRAVLAFGRPIDAVQIVDVMVEGRERGVLTRRGPFFLVTEAFLRQWIGEDSIYRVGFGFPSLRHLRLAAKLGLYEQVDEVVQFEFDLRQDAAPAPAGRRHAIDAIEIDWTAAGLERRFARLWDAMRAKLADQVVGVRDAARWRYRYHDHPDRPYRCLWLRAGWLRRTLAAVAVREEPGALQLMDWVGDPDETPRIVAAVRSMARESGRARVYGWASRQVAARLAECGAREVPIEVGVPMSALKFDALIPAIRGRWWLTGGDTDFL